MTFHFPLGNSNNLINTQPQANSKQDETWDKKGYYFCSVVYRSSKMLERIDFQSLRKQVAFEGCNNGEIDMVRMSNVIRYLRAKGNPTR